MRHLRHAPAALFGLSLSLVLSGCPEKKVEPPPPPPEKHEAKPLPPPPPAAAPRADKECAAPIDPGPVTELKFGERVAKLSGARLTFADKDADGVLTLGVLGPVNEDSGANMVALKKYVKFFTDEKVDAIVVSGDVGEVASGITRVLKELGATKLPVFVVIGNRECRGEYTDGVNAAKAEFPNIVNLNETRVVEFPELTLISLPGHHDPKYFGCSTSCLYLPSTVEEVVRVAKDAKTPVALVSHGPPRGSGNQALDFAGGRENVGDEAISKAITDAKIAFGFHSNIKEAGARAAKDVAGTQLLKEGEASETLYLNPGPADATVGWDMNDGTKAMGLAAVFSLKDGKGSYKLLRLKAMTPAEKAEARRLEPPAAPAPSPGAPAPAPGSPAPAPGAPAPAQP
ncbi:MAG: metallophosphoesterase [Myxococcota bacterium]